MELKKIKNTPNCILSKAKQWLIIGQLQKWYPGTTVKKEAWNSPASFMKKFISKFDNPEVIVKLTQIQQYFAGELAVKSPTLQSKIEKFQGNPNLSLDDILYRTCLNTFDKYVLL